MIFLNNSLGQCFDKFCLNATGCQTADSTEREP